MSKIGAVVLGVFAAVWGISAAISAQAPAWAMLVPILVTAALLIPVWRDSRAQARSAAEQRRITRLVSWASAAEGFGILVAVNVATWAGRTDLMAACVAAIVGLHMLPLARGMPAPRYYVTATALLLVAAAGIAFPRSATIPIICGSCAVILWATVGSALFDLSRTRIAS